MSVDTLEFKRDVLLAALSVSNAPVAPIHSMLVVSLPTSGADLCQVLYGGRVAGDEFQRTVGAFFAIYWLLRCCAAEVLAVQ